VTCFARRRPEAKKELEKAVEIYPKSLPPGMSWGRFMQGEAAGTGENAYSKALEADPKLVTPYLQLAQLAAMEGKWQEVADTSDRAIKLNPFDFPYAFFVNAVANYNLRKLDAAEKSVLEAQKLDKMHRIPKVEQLLGIILAERRDYNGAATALRNYMQFLRSQRSRRREEAVGRTGATVGSSRRLPLRLRRLLRRNRFFASTQTGTAQPGPRTWR